MIPGINPVIMNIMCGATIIDCILYQLSPQTQQLFCLQKNDIIYCFSYGHSIGRNGDCDGPEHFVEITHDHFQMLKTQQQAFDNQFFN
jgi:hypothetical protein